jgi:S1-C subfamily serine protease
MPAVHPGHPSRWCGVALAAFMVLASADAGAGPGALVPAPADRVDSPEALREFEARVRDAVARALPTVVALVIGADGAEGPRGTGSGTIISEDGWVLTAGHVGQQPGRQLTVILSDGTSLPGITAGQHFGPDGDVGLVKIDAPGRTFAFAPIGRSADLATGDPVIALGHPLGPELRPWRPPPVRVGRVLGRDGPTFAIDAPLSPGDSGGGVFDLEGRLVGVNSAASERPDLNLAATVESAQARMESMREGLATGEWLQDPAANPVEVAAKARLQDVSDAPIARPGDSPAERRDQRARRQDMLDALAPLTDPYADAVVTLIVDSRDACHGVFIDEDGHVLTKASELGTGARRIDVLLNDGLSVRGRRVATDRELDLAVIATDVTDVTPVEFSAGPEPALGDAVITVGRGIAPLAVGHRSLGEYASGGSDAASRAYLGVAMRAPGEAERAALADGVGQVVESVIPGSGADEAGVQVGDVILRIDGVPLDDPEAAAVPLRSHAPGEDVTLEVRTVLGEVRTLQVRLLRPAWADARGNAGGPLSRRATGFGPVIQHDGVVPANHVGSPVVDGAGRVVGLNIARADRMKTYALASARVAASIEAMMARVRAGEVLADDDPAEGLAPAAFALDGFARLEPGAARVFGPTNRIRAASEDGKEPAAVAGFGDFDDMVAWRLRVPGVGRYDVSIDAQGVAGGKLDVFFGEELLTVAVPARRAGRIRVGEVVAMEPGDITVRVQPLGRPSAPIAELRAVTVQRTDQLRAVEQVIPLARFRDMERYRREFEREQRRRERRDASKEQQR